MRFLMNTATVVAFLDTWCMFLHVRAKCFYMYMLFLLLSFALGRAKGAQGECSNK